MNCREAGVKHNTLFYGVKKLQENHGINEFTKLKFKELYTNFEEMLKKHKITVDSLANCLTSG